MRAAALILAASALVGCEQRRSGGGLPPAADWQAPPPLAVATGTGGDPHAGLDLEGAGGAPDPAMAGLEAPDPDRPIDPDRFLRGHIVSSPATAAAVRPGAILFLSVKPIDPTSGDVIGPTLAVERLDLASLPVDFALTEANSMVAGTSLAGDVVVLARVDGDGEARTREPGDVEGSVRARVPAAGLELVLDHRVD